MMNKYDIILDESDIDRILTRMFHEILEKHRGAETLAFIGIHTRGVHIATRIRDRIMEFEGVEIPAGIMDITLYRDDWTTISHQHLQHFAVAGTSSSHWQCW